MEFHLCIIVSVMCSSKSASVQYSATVKCSVMGQCDLSAGAMDVYRQLQIDHTLLQCLVF